MPSGLGGAEMRMHIRLVPCGLGGAEINSGLGGVLGCKKNVSFGRTSLLSVLGCFIKAITIITDIRHEILRVYDIFYFSLSVMLFIIWFINLYGVHESSLRHI